MPWMLDLYLLGEADGPPTDARLVLLVGVSTIVGGAVTWAFNAVLEWQSRRRKERKEDEKSIVQHLETLVERLRIDNGDLHAEVDQLRADLTKEQLFGERVLGYIRYLETLLRVKRIPFDPFDPGSGSAHEMPAAGPNPPRKPPKGAPPPAPEGDADG